MAQKGAVLQVMMIIGEWVTRRRDEWNEHVSRKAPGRIVRTVRDNSPVFYG
jgi:hypothetical protein